MFTLSAPSQQTPAAGLGNGSFTEQHPGDGAGILAERGGGSAGSCGCPDHLAVGPGAAVRFVSTLDSFQGSAVANASIVPGSGT
jgi:hypothetical protein